VPVDPFLHRVDAGEREGPGAGQQRRPACQFGEELPAGFLQLADVPPGEGPQVRAERGRGADVAEQGAHRAVPQHVHVIDRVRARDQGRHLQVRVHPALAAGADVLRD